MGASGYISSPMNIATSLMNQKCGYVTWIRFNPVSLWNEQKEKKSNEHFYSREKN